jgi:hypothetical protein
LLDCQIAMQRRQGDRLTIFFPQFSMLARAVPRSGTQKSRTGEGAAFFKAG